MILKLSNARDGWFNLSRLDAYITSFITSGAFNLIFNYQVTHLITISHRVIHFPPLNLIPNSRTPTRNVYFHLQPIKTRHFKNTVSVDQTRLSAVTTPVSNQCKSYCSWVSLKLLKPDLCLERSSCWDFLH